MFAGGTSIVHGDVDRGENLEGRTPALFAHYFGTECLGDVIV